MLSGCKDCDFSNNIIYLKPKILTKETNEQISEKGN